MVPPRWEVLFGATREHLVLHRPDPEKSAGEHELRGGVLALSLELAYDSRNVCGVDFVLLEDLEAAFVQELLGIGPDVVVQEWIRETDVLECCHQIFEAQVEALFRLG